MSNSFYSTENQEINNSNYTTTRNTTPVRITVHQLNLKRLNKQSSINYDIDTFLSDGLLKEICKEQGIAKKRLTLNKEEEREIIIKAQQGDTKASTLLIQSLLNYLCQVTEYAYRFLGTKVASITKDDLFEEVLKGTLEVLPRFDTTRNCRFVTYLDMHLTNYLQQLILSWRKNEDVEVRNYDSFYRYNSDGEIEEIEHDYIEDYINSSYSAYQEVYDALFQLSDREREIISGRILSKCPLKELAEELQISTQRVYELQKRAEKKLYHLLKLQQCA